ncbi:MAG: glucosaminidase domain-containing protein [Saprospirales bacterium]|nr:glucosaminidase domain-containing protein [Saprospirales bacterium]
MAHYQSAYGTMAAAAQAPRRGVIDWIGKYWFQILLVLLGLHTFLQRDISIRVNMRSLSSLESTSGERAAEGAMKVLPASLKSSARPAAFSLLDRGGSGENTRQGAAFYYLLNPKAAKKDNVARDILVQELERSRKLVERFAKVALAERAKFNLPAGIIMAQAILSSQNGASPLVSEGNNYFGQMDGKKVRHFHSAWESFREHSLTMRGNELEALQRIPLTDYKGWAKGLQELGFSAEPDYAKNLVRIVEILDLDQFDRV